MMRLRRAWVIVALLLLTSAATASAECAWVLWATGPGTDTLLMFLPLGGWKTLEECEKVRATKQPEPGRTAFASPTPWTRAGRRGSERDAGMNFRLIYEGALPTNGTAAEKQAIRRVLHLQLAELWNQPPLLTFVENGQLRTDSVVEPSLLVERGGFVFAAVVTTRLHLMAHLDILFLRPGSPGSLIVQGGDIDNRLKTLFDALQIPDENQIATDPPPSPDQTKAPWGAAPFFCVLENDALITRVNVETDRLLKPDTGGVGKSRVLLVINVTLRASQLAYNNMDLVS